MSELAVVMPVYNEEGAIQGVLEKWAKELDRLGMDYEIHVYNDGSKDHTSALLKSAAATHPRVRAHDKKNSGHGPTILQGYRDNSMATWLFQIDSDDEMGPEGFQDLWSRRKDYDFLLGTRDGRKSPLPRKLISLISRMTVRLFYGAGIWDVNSPFRLMRSETFRELFLKLPPTTFAPNVIISGYACKKRLRICQVTVPCRARQAGTVSIKKWKLLKAALKSFVQTTCFAVKIG